MTTALKTIVQRGKRVPAGRAAGLLIGVLTVAALAAAGCRDQKTKPSPAEAARQKIMDNLILPPDARLMESRVQSYSLDTRQGPLVKTILFFHFTTNESVDTISRFYEAEIKRRGFRLTSDSGRMMAYEDKSGRTIYASWSEPEHPEADYRSTIHLGVEPVPPELLSK